MNTSQDPEFPNKLPLVLGNAGPRDLVPVGEQSLEHDVGPDGPLLGGHGSPPFARFVRKSIALSFVVVLVAPRVTGFEFKTGEE